MLSAWLAGQALRNAKIWPRHGSINGWTLRTTSQWSTPTCVPLCTVTPLQQEALKSGNLLGHSSRTPPLQLKLTNSGLLWPAQSIPGCSTGLLTDSLVNFVIQYTTMYNWQFLTSTQVYTLPTVLLVPFQVPGVHSGSKHDQKAGRYFYHCLHCQQCGWSVSGMGLCQSSLVIHFHSVSITEYFKVAILVVWGNTSLWPITFTCRTEVT